MTRLKRIKALFNPPEFQGWGKNKRYFEGWYFKLVNPSEEHAFAVIPGVAMDESGARQAFVQVLDGKRRTAEYHRFRFDQFNAKPGVFEVTIDENYFSAHRMHIELPGLGGELSFSNAPGPRDGTPRASWGPIRLHLLWSATMGL